MTALDTNIFIYACDRTDLVRQEKALDVIASSSDGVLLWQVACEFIAATRKLSDQGFTRTHAWDRLAEILAVFPLILPVPGVLTRAQHLHADQAWSFWDAMIVAACLEAGIERLYTEDLPGRTDIPLEIINPF